MKLKHLYIAGLAIMLLMNGVLIFMMLQKPSGPPQPQNARPGNQPGLKEIIHTELQFSPEQMRQFDQLVIQHGEAMREIEREQKQLATSYFNSLTEETVDVEMQNALLEELKEFEGRKLQVTYAHFSELKELCSPEQRAKFDLIVDDMLLVLIGPQNNRRPPPPRPRDF